MANSIRWYFLFTLSSSIGSLVPEVRGLAPINRFKHPSLALLLTDRSKAVTEFVTPYLCLWRPFYILSLVLMCRPCGWFGGRPGIVIYIAGKLLLLGILLCVFVSVGFLHLILSRKVFSVNSKLLSALTSLFDNHAH